MVVEKLDQRFPGLVHCIVLFYKRLNVDIASFFRTCKVYQITLQLGASCS